MRRGALAAAVTCAAVATTCAGGASPTRPTTPTPIAAAANTYDGTWTMVAGDGAVTRFSFVVRAGSITYIDADYNLAKTATPCAAGGGFGAGGSLGTIVNDAFSFRTPAPPTQYTSTYIVSGRFVSPTDAVGQIDVQIAPLTLTSCAKEFTLYWTAQRMP